jgi:hypothetical protein
MVCLRATPSRKSWRSITGPIFDGLYEFHRRATLLGREPA